MTVVATSTLELEPIAGTIYEHRRKRCEITYIPSLFTRLRFCAHWKDILSCWAACREKWVVGYTINKESRANFIFRVSRTFVPVERSRGSTSSVGAGAGFGGTADPSGKTLISTCLGPIQTRQYINTYINDTSHLINVLTTAFLVVRPIDYYSESQYIHGCTTNMNPTYSLDYILSILALFAQLREPTVSTVSTASTVSTLSTTRYRQLQADLTHTVPPRCSETRSFPAHHGAQLCCLSRQGLRSQSPT